MMSIIRPNDVTEWINHEAVCKAAPGKSSWPSK